MNFSNKFLRNFFILVIFATLTISLPIQILIVTAPGPDPKVAGTMQIASWFCILCKSKDNVKIEVIENLSKIVFTTTVSLNK